MLNLGELTNTVQKNCHISDARHASNYSMCIFLLKMREYYRWEYEIPFSVTLSMEEIGDWLFEREQTWDKLESANYQRLPLTRGTVDPFDAEVINSELVPQGYVYSSGYGPFSKPLFFLGQLIKKEKRGGINVLVSSCEYARDLVAPPAMTLGGTVFVRQDSMRRFLWEKIEEWQWRKRDDTPMARAIAYYGPDCGIETLLDKMMDNEIEAVILHEIGEARAGELLGPEWEQMLSAFHTSKAEFVIRAVRDHLADCLSTLPALVETENEGALHFYFANFSGMRKTLFPEAMDAYRRWIKEKSLAPLRETCRRGREHWQQTAETMLTCYRNDGEDVQAAIENLLCSSALR